MAAAAEAPACAICGTTEDIKKCSACKQVWYCSVDHQKEDRPAHRAACKAASGGGNRAPASMRLGWARGLTAEQQREWLTDCYRMRVDDDAVWGGGNLHGLYAASDRGGGPNMIADDFLVFCKLAVKQKCVPAEWNWPAFLTKARQLLPYAFEKEDAKDKWGSENVFNATMGGRSLRATAEAVYGTGCMFGGSDMMGNDRCKLAEDVHKAVKKWAKGPQARNDNGMFDGVGGAEPWRELYNLLRMPSARAS